MSIQFFIAIAIAIIVTLSIIAGYYLWLLHRKRQDEHAAVTALEKQLDQRYQRNLESIEIIARALLQEQVSLTEASIRINTLSQTLRLTEIVSEDLSVFRQLSEATAHIPIFERWRELPKKEKLAFDKERETIEGQFKEFVVVAAEKIVHKQILRVS